MFLLNYIRYPKTTGAIIQSSKALAQVITEGAVIECANNIIEIGAGSGAFTKEILRKKSPNAKFFRCGNQSKLRTGAKSKISKFGYCARLGKRFKRNDERARYGECGHYHKWHSVVVFGY